LENLVTGRSGLPADFDSTRAALHRVAVHILGRRRYQVAGRFGLRASPGGFATPAFGTDVEVIRVDRGVLFRETTAGAGQVGLNGSSLGELARFVGCDLSAEFSAGADTPDLGDPDEPLDVGTEASTALAAWYHTGWQILDEVIAGLPGDPQPAVIQMWPEHFDAGTNVALASGERVNLGASPGDGFCNDPYLYVGPWSDKRPGDPAFWNAPFGAVLARAELLAGLEPLGRGVQFIRAGLALLNG
jgi:hypothetical protein